MGANIKKVTHYAASVHGQPNNNHPNASLKNDWDVNGKASASDVTKAPKGSITSLYSWKLTKQTKSASYFDEKIPWTATGLEFGFNVPDCAYIKDIKFEARIKVSGTIKVKAPVARFREAYKLIKNDEVSCYVR